ncbi:MAG: hypothetical protein ACLTA1_13125, partial [Clostridia bacterium]
RGHGKNERSPPNHSRRRSKKGESPPLKRKRVPQKQDNPTKPFSRRMKKSSVKADRKQRQQLCYGPCKL